MPQGNTALTHQGTNWISPFQNTDSAGVPFQLIAYTGTFTTTPPAAPQSPYVVTDGYDGAIYAYIIENNVGTATLAIEGSFDSVRWAALGYYTIWNNGAGNATLARVVTSFAQSQNTFSLLQVLDATPLMRVRPSANSGSISAGFYLVPA